MPQAKRQSSPPWGPLFLCAGAAILLLAFRFWPAEVPDPRATAAHDQSHYVALTPLPEGWTTTWTVDTDAPRRLTLASPRRDTSIEVLAFSGALDEKKFQRIGNTLFGASFPAPYRTTATIEYERHVQRSEFKVASKAQQVVNTSIDVLWHNAEKDHVYVIIARSLDDTGVNVQAVRDRLRFYPPIATAIGRLRRSTMNALDLGEQGLALASWAAAIVWGLWYTGKLLDKKWRPAKYVVGSVVMGLGFVARVLLSLSWTSTLIAMTTLLAAAGASAALLSGQWEIQD